MSHVFISYSTKNRAYAYKLRDALRDEGFDVWIDNRKLRASEDWWRSIVLAIRDCAAFVVILTPEADNSKWVQREITLAEKYNKPNFPLWLSRDINTPNWELFVRTQITDVRGEQLPDDAFYEMLAETALRKRTRGMDRAIIIPELLVAPEDLSEIDNPPPVETSTDDDLLSTSTLELYPPDGALTEIIPLEIGFSPLVEDVVALQPTYERDSTTEPSQNITPSSRRKLFSLERIFTGFLFSVAIGLIIAIIYLIIYNSYVKIMNNIRIANLNIVERTFDDGVTMVQVPAGCFEMGSDNGSVDEKNGGRVCFDELFWIDKYEVSNGQFNRLGGVVTDKSNISTFPIPTRQFYFLGEVPERDNRWYADDLPRESITWFEARDFCEQKRTAGTRLPTEPEWEYAARGPDSLVYPWGNTFMADYVVYADNSGDKTAPVGSRPGGVSWVGALDISGNVWEWVSSLYVDYPYSEEKSEDNTNRSRVRRGGAWDNYDYVLRSAFRSDLDPVYEDNSVGFRCARS